MTVPRRVPALVEIGVCSVEDAVTAEAAGAARLELNAALSLGGITPSLGVLGEVRASVRLPVTVMIRPRPGGFCYSAREYASMRRDIDLVLENGADGIVLGFLT